MVMWMQPMISRAGQGLRVGVFLAERHERGHLRLRQGDLLAAEVGQVDVCYLKIGHVVFQCLSSEGEWLRRHARSAKSMHLQAESVFLGKVLRAVFLRLSPARSAQAVSSSGSKPSH